jgi:hypothetical protein
MDRALALAARYCEPNCSQLTRRLRTISVHALSQVSVQVEKLKWQNPKQALSLAHGGCYGDGMLRDHGTRGRHRSWLAAGLPCLFAGSLFAGSLLASCGASLPATEYAKIRGCDADQVDVRELPSTSVQRYSVRGCGKSTEIQCWNGKCRSPEFEVQERHARELGCMPNDVTAIDREEGHFIADGCGKRADYVCKFDPLSIARCEAVVNSR